MKKITFILFLSFLFGKSNAQDMNRIIFDPGSEEDILYGYCNREGFVIGPSTSWFEPEYQSYLVDDSTLFSIDPELILTTNITVVLGTWCSDSQREIPRLYKILDYLHYPETNLRMICIDRTKNAEGIDVASLDIQLVPTIIFYSSDTETGRIIESPEVSLEHDMVRILGQ